MRFLAEGGKHILLIRRLQCTCCERIHHELPDCLVPYKRYESRALETVLHPCETHTVVCAENSTLYRWHMWFQGLLSYWIECLSAITHRLKLEDAEEIIPPSSSSLRGLFNFVGESLGWLGRIVRPLVHSCFWQQTRSALDDQV